MQKKIKNAFTLAEVLTVIAIIGIVASLTIPMMKSKIESQVYLTAAKRSYSDLTAGIKMMMADEGCPDILCLGLFNSDTENSDAAWNDKIDAIVRKDFKVSQSFKYGVEMNYPKIKALQMDTGGSTEFAKTLGYRFITLNGTIFSFKNRGCFSEPYQTGKLKYQCFDVTMDTNGFKGPNQYGKDVFGSLAIGQDGGIYPATGKEWTIARTNSTNPLWRDNSAYCASTNSLSTYKGSYVEGQNCLARIIEEGWELNYLK